ncbi:RNA polymerase sigma factor [Duganella violaceipulchra]|uniref:RNA polymerase sigma-70 factor (ECF subfamily) n=1 Tax=Duganella violaceipulchra TaxID=2849652 RepID=A0AA41HF20_9BURK|nr:sigma-70 family RNA polymerase sigma factor [Duganella violaceicalia]MBV6323777.1 sigma-70 family RNA polymerase sigma factor [Duganella violaceicalia]MCP2007467.1 RNA polymerase sigma-70 factor (ECF subfamily) [Duganella violaceicalia]
MSPPAAAYDSPYTPDFMKRLLYTYAFRSLGSEASAMDAVQSTLEALVTGERRFRGDSAYSTFIFAILRNKISDELRARMRYDDDSETAQLESDELARGQSASDELTEPEQQAHTSRLMDALSTGLGKMSCQGRQVFLLTELCGYGGAEIGAQLGLTTSHVWVLLHRARKFARAALDDLVQSAEKMEAIAAAQRAGEAAP